MRKENNMEDRTLHTPQTAEARLVKLMNHLSEKESDFGSLPEDLVVRDALVKYVFPEFDIRYWDDEETNDAYERVVGNELKYLRQEMGE